MARADSDDSKPPAQARGRATRSRLLEAGAVEIARRGYENASLTKICRDAGVTTGAFYTHFTSKSALATELAADQEAKVQALAEHISDLLPSAFDRALCFASDLAELVSRDIRVQACLQLSLEHTVEPPLVAWKQWERIAQQLVATAQRRGVDHHPEHMGALSVASVLGAWLLTRDESAAHLEATLAEIWTALAGGAVCAEDQASALASVETLFAR